MNKNQTLKQFEQNKAKNIALLQKLLGFVDRGKEFGVNLVEASKEKIQNAISQENDEKLKIAIVGGFSKGKTSIVAAWLEKLKEDMKIDSQESSDEIEIYNIDDELEIVDTPGLFGYKGDDKGKFKDKTEKFVSQTHILLYVMDSSNPIKNSHKEELQWLFRELDLLSRTIFVCSKFDESADLDDEEEYQAKFKETRQNVLSELRNAIHLSQEEEQKLQIVAVSANPYGKGIECWLEPQHLDEFRKISRIKSLQDATTQTISKTGKKDLILASYQSITSDILTQQIPVILKECEIYEQESKKLEELLQDTNTQIQKLSGELNESKINLKEWVKRYFTDLILQAQGLNMQNANEFIIREIGEEGINIATRIENEFEREMGPLNTRAEQLALKFENKIRDFNDSMTQTLLKQGVKQMTSMRGMINANTIKMARDGIVSLGKLVGVNLSEYLKFAPWGAIKLAKGANAALAAAGIVYEAWDSYDNMKKEEEFKKDIEKMTNNFNDQKKKILEHLDSENFKKSVPLFEALTAQCDELKKELEKINQRKQAVQEWKQEGEVIEAEFEQIKQLELK